MQNRLKILLGILFVCLAFSSIFFAVKYFDSQRRLDETTAKQTVNDNVLSFTRLFMAKVLRGGSEVSFEDRLQLENSVRALNDKDIFTAWDRFTKAKNQAETQQYFYTLFDLLLKKIAI